MGRCVHRSPGLVRLVVALNVAAWICYSSWVLSPLLSSGIDDARAWVSELGADDQPHHLVYRLGDRFAGAFMVLAALVPFWVSRDWARRRLWSALAWLLGIGGANLLVEAFNPLPCAPSLDPVCRSRLLSDNPTVAEQFHRVASVVGTSSLVLALALGWWATRPAAVSGAARIRWLVLGGLIVVAAVGEVCSGMSIGPLIGLEQRVALAAMSISGIWVTARLVSRFGSPG